MSDKELILVVDDDPDLVDMVATKLAANNYRIAKAYDGVQAWEQIRKEKPAMVIMDVMMPNKDGYATCEEIKKDPNFKDIPVVLLTAVVDNLPTTSYTHHEGRTTPADDFIPKPVDLDKLMDIVQENLER
jgi:two-component system, OmpR family, alkaline phosphatase synthesis response regulator PhoP